MSNKIYIWAAGPDNLRGGPEVLCLLCHTLRGLGVNAKMFNLRYGKNCVPNEFRKNYDIETCDNSEILSASGATIVLPELLIQQEEQGLVQLLDLFKGNQIMIWFLSTDFTGIITTTWKNIFETLKFYKNVTYLCESRAVWNLLEFYGVREKKFMLQHSTHTMFRTMAPSAEKKSIVLYNGYKERTRLIVERAIVPKLGNNIEVVGLLPGKRLNKEELCALMDSAKCYVDFCGFKGREMVPREAALRNCVLLLGNEGCASYFEDYPIPSWYKISDITDTDAIAAKIEYVINNYDNCMNDMVFMKRRCDIEHELFVCEVKIVFCI